MITSWQLSDRLSRKSALNQYQNAGFSHAALKPHNLMRRHIMEIKVKKVESVKATQNPAT